MSLDAEVGAKVELGEFSLKALAGVGATLDGIHQQLTRLAAYEEAYQFGAKDIPLRDVQSSDSAGDTLILDLGGPTQGRKWQVRRISIGGPLYTTTVAGKGLVVVQSSRNTTPAMSDVADVATTLPNVAFYSTGQLTVRHPNRLYIVVLTPTGSTQYAAGAVATEMPDKRTRIETTD